MGFFDSQTIEIPCPDCGKEHPKTIGWIKTHSDLTCSCGVKIELDKGEFVRQIARIEKSLDSIPREITIRL